MSLESTALTKRYSGNGSTTNFSFPYAFIKASDLDVYLVDVTGVGVLKTLTSDYSVVGAFNPLTNAYDDFSSGGTVEFVTAPSAAYKVFIIRYNPDTQDTSLVLNSRYSSAVMEAALDKIMMVMQRVRYRADRSIRLADEVDTSAFTQGILGTIPAYAIASTDATASKWVWVPNATLAQAYVGAGAIPETPFTFANNQGSAANVTGLTFGAAVRSAEIDVQFYRLTTSTGAVELCARAKYLATQKSGGWDMTCLGFDGDADASTGNPAGVGLTITSAGQVQYISSNITGTASQSVMHFRANTMGI